MNNMIRYPPSTVTTWMVLLLLPMLSAVVTGDASNPCRRTCVVGDTRECTFDFTLEWYRTLSKACYDCPFNLTDCYRPQCIAGDGLVRPVLAVNRQVPGPAIEVCEGDRVRVLVTNHLDDGLSTSVHFHGLHMLNNPFYDGVGQVTQCHIQHQETFEYKFEASPAGSHWYHAHTGLQMADGLFGPLVVRQASGADPNDALYDDDLSEHTLMLYDWFPELAMSRHLRLMHMYYPLPASIMVNGRSRQYNVTNEYELVDTNLTHAQTPLEVLHVQQGRKYRLRVISAAPNCPLQVSVDGHQLMVISVDGMPLAPRMLDAFILHPGERYDFVLTADKDVSNYWVKVLGLGDCDSVKANGAAILRYQGAPSYDPNGDPTVPRDGTLLNPVLYDGDVPKMGSNRPVILTDDMRYGHSTNYTDERVDFKYFVGMDYNNNDNSKYNDKDLYNVKDLKTLLFHSTPVIDNITFALPPVPLLSQPEDVQDAWFCNRSTLENPEHCLTEDLCMCTHLLRIGLGQTVELIVFHEGRIFNELGHIMHLHGYSFRLLGVGKVGPSVSRATIEDMDSQGLLRRNLIQPPMRDTINVPDGGYVILRFKADNPGLWFFHCHTDGHLSQGMAVLLKVGQQSDLPPVPKQFPRCGGMGFSNAERKDPTPCTSNPASRVSPRALTSLIASWLVGLFIMICN